jgi:hypothetical protein
MVMNFSMLNIEYFAELDKQKILAHFKDLFCLFIETAEEIIHLIIL